MTATRDPHACSRALLADSGVEHEHVLTLARATLDEDLSLGPDVTTESTISATASDTAHVVARAPGTLAGLGVAATVVELLAVEQAASVTVRALARDGDRVAPEDRVLAVSGPLRVLLTAERSLLNLLCQLSGVATETARWVDAVGRDTTGRPRSWVRDTRKTVPGLRSLQKYAVRCGGGVNHRMALGDAALIKDNHVAAAGSIAAAYHAVRERHPTVAVEVECDTLDQVSEALEVGAELILLDNMDTATMGRAVALARPRGVRLEASGGLSLDRAADVAATGVDYISVGALTHSAPVLDLALDLEPRALAG